MGRKVPHYDENATGEWRDKHHMFGTEVAKMLSGAARDAVLAPSGSVCVIRDSTTAFPIDRKYQRAVNDESAWETYERCLAASNMNISLFGFAASGATLGDMYGQAEEAAAAARGRKMKYDAVFIIG